MATIIFDFDSTLVGCESLELILKEKLKDRPEAKNEILEITQQGLRGVIPFSESLARRLAIASPSLKEVEEFGFKALGMITLGMKKLITEWISQGVDVWVVSGGIYESLLPVCRYLGIKDSHVMAVKLLWGNQGEFIGIDPNDALSRSKIEGVADVSSQWNKPTVVVGDAVSDYRLYEQNIVEHFVLYTEHLACREIIDLGVECAENTEELREKINVLIR